MWLSTAPITYISTFMLYTTTILKLDIKNKLIVDRCPTKPNISRKGRLHKIIEIMPPDGSF